ncbi:VOC family protein, partial [Streptomyces sp. NPDC059597]
AGGALPGGGVAWMVCGGAAVWASSAGRRARGGRAPPPPTVQGPMLAAVLDDTVGNLIQLTQPIP